MFVRCNTCEVSVPVRNTGPGGAPVAICPSCNYEYDLTPLSGMLQSLEPTEPQADESPPTPLTQAPRDDPAPERDLTPSSGRLPSEPIEPRAAESRPKPLIQEPPYDPAFAPAVKAGRLTVGQAVQRGLRASYAQRVMKRHKLTLAQALDIADNRIALSAVMLDREEREEREEAAPAAERKAALIAAYVVALVMLCVIFLSGGIGFWRSYEAVGSGGRPEPSPHVERMAVLARAEISTDDDGNMTEVVASDAVSVLRAFCAGGPGTRAKVPIELTPPNPPVAGVRIGIFEDPSKGGGKYAITIARRGGPRRWVTGDGEGPIPVERAPELAADAARFPVR